MADDLQLKIINLQYYDTMSDTELDSSRNDTLNTQLELVEFNLSKLDLLINELSTVRDSMAHKKSRICHLQCIDACNKFVFIHSDTALCFGDIPCKKIGDGYIVNIRDIPKKDIRVSGDSYKIKLQCVNNRVRKNILMSNVSLVTEDEACNCDHHNTDTIVRFIRM